MEKKYLIGAGVIALGLFAYSRYAKKDESGQAEEQGGGGGGGFMPNYPTPEIPLYSPTPPTPVAKTSAGIQPIKITNPTVLAGLGAGKPVAATTSSTGAGAVSGVGSGSGISGIGSGSGSGSTTSVGSGSGIIPSPGATMTGTAGGTVFKPFSGGESNGKTPIYLNDLVRSWNRP